ncbi:MAG: prepilin peptidase [Verrucomicrobia bacterium]|nr:prepilin peptidase [Verrucomicrobiota bacterium]
MHTIQNVFDRELWVSLPPWFWTSTLFVFGCMVGSFLNVCIYRMPIGLSIVSPPSHCPKCGYSIPWYLNMPLITWLWLRGRCAHCKAGISVRYFLVELLTGIAFAACWLRVGQEFPSVALSLCVLIAGFIVATFIDFDHFIIPDEITLGGIGVGIALSLLVPELHHTESHVSGLIRSAVGAAVGWGITYAVLQAGKLAFGKQKVPLEPNTKVLFTETGVHIQGEETPFEEIFSRPSDEIRLRAHTAWMPGSGQRWEDVEVRLSPSRLKIGTDEFDPEKITELAMTCDALVLPREAMGFGDVKFMGAIGAFLGWQGAVFSLLASSVIGAVLGLSLIIARKKEWSSKLPYGPYIAAAATLWIFVGDALLAWWQARL